VSADEELTIDEQLEELERVEREEAKAKRDAATKRRLERFALKKRFTAELRGDEGVAFSIVETPGGFVVFKLAPGVVFKKLQRSEMLESDVDEFLQALLVFPEPDRFVKIVDTYPGTGNELLAAATRLYGVAYEDRQKK